VTNHAKVTNGPRYRIPKSGARRMDQSASWARLSWWDGAVAGWNPGSIGACLKVLGLQRRRTENFSIRTAAQRIAAGLLLDLVDVEGLPSHFRRSAILLDHGMCSYKYGTGNCIGSSYRLNISSSSISWTQFPRLLRCSFCLSNDGVEWLGPLPRPLATISFSFVTFPPSMAGV